MPAYADAPVRRLASSGSTNALFRLGEDLLVRLPRQPGGSATISKEATWLPVLGPLLPVSVPDVVGVFEPDREYPERWSVVRWIDGAHPEVVDPDTSVDPGREDLARDLASVLRAFRQTEVPTWQSTTRTCRRIEASRSRRWTRTRERTSSVAVPWRASSSTSTPPRRWGDAMKLPGVADRPTPRWYHGDLAAENLLVRDRALTAVLDFGGLSVGDPTVDLVVAWEVLDPPAGSCSEGRSASTTRPGCAAGRGHSPSH